MNRTFLTFLLFLLILPLGVSHPETTTEIFTTLQHVQGSEIPAPFKSLLRNDIIDAQITHEDGTLSYFTLTTRQGRFTAASHARAASPTVRVVVKEGVIDTVKQAEDKAAALREAYEDGDIQVRGIGYRRRITLRLAILLSML